MINCCFRFCNLNLRLIRSGDGGLLAVISRGRINQDAINRESKITRRDKETDAIAHENDLALAALGDTEGTGGDDLRPAHAIMPQEEDDGNLVHKQIVKISIIQFLSKTEKNNCVSRPILNRSSFRIRCFNKQCLFKNTIIFLSNLVIDHGGDVLEQIELEFVDVTNVHEWHVLVSHPEPVHFSKNIIFAGKIIFVPAFIVLKLNLCEKWSKIEKTKMYKFKNSSEKGLMPSGLSMYGGGRMAYLLLNSKF